MTSPPPTKDRKRQRHEDCRPCLPLSAGFAKPRDFSRRRSTSQQHRLRLQPRRLVRLGEARLLVSSTPPNAPFRDNDCVKSASITDGLGNSLLATEVKTHTPYLLNCTDLVYAPLSANPMPGPTDSPSVIRQYSECSGPPAELSPDSGHSEWEDGNTSQTGFTTAWPPITITPGRFGAISVVDTDLIAIREENGGPTFAAVAARSYHFRGVKTLLGDGSVRFVKQTIAGTIRRALGSIAGSEVVSADAF